MTSGAQKVPIVVYHSIADDHDHLLRPLSLSVDVFERQLQFLKRRGFETVSLHDVHAYLERGVRLPQKAVALTFDDGFLDNWVHAFPLLHKYGMKATIFVTTEFVDPTDTCRPTLEDVWSGAVDRDSLEWWGHLSWPELRRMQESGLVEIQSHTKTHTWYPISGKIVDFHHPGDDYYWLDWNAFPENKHSWLTRDFRASVPWGTPVYEFAQTLLNRRYLEDPATTRCAVEHVANHGGEDFFSRGEWKQELLAVVEQDRQGRTPGGRLETEEAYVERLRQELIGSKKVLEEHLSAPVDFLCWPCGDYTEQLQRFAIEECGYRATVNVAKVTNRRGDDPTELRRIVFGQDYLGPFSSHLIYWHFCGNVSYQSGSLWAFPMAPIARRLMMVGRMLRRVSA